MPSYPTCSHREADARCEARAVVRFNQNDPGEWGTWGQQYGCAEHREILTTDCYPGWTITELTAKGTEA